MTAAPLVADGKVLVGISGGDGPIRGFVAAYDPNTGKEVWRCFTIPAPGEPGSETWPQGDQWQTGGGATWVTGNYDPETNLVFWGVGNGNPWVAAEREGDNLYTASTIAIDAATGKIKGYFQYTPNEAWDFDEVSPPLLIDFKRDGRTIKGLVDFTRSGYLYFLERTDSNIKFIEGKPYVKQNIFKSLDPKTGRPDVDLAHKSGVDKLADFCPSWHGGKNWEPGAYSPKTRMVYIPTQENICAVMVGRILETPSGGRRAATTIQMYVVPGADHISEVQAWNVDTGKKVWSHNFAKSPNWGPDAGDRRRLGLQRRNERSPLPRVRRGDRRSAVGIPDKLGRLRAALVLHDRRQAVRRRRVGMGPGREIDGVSNQRRVAGPLSGRAGRWRDLGVRREMSVQSKTTFHRIDRRHV